MGYKKEDHAVAWGYMKFEKTIAQKPESKDQGTKFMSATSEHKIRDAKKLKITGQD